MLNILYVVYAVVVYLVKKDVAPGWTTLSLQHGVMFFLLFSILAILSEYVGRIVAQTSGRPLYFVAEEKSSSVTTTDPDQRNIVRESKA